MITCQLSAIALLSVSFASGIIGFTAGLTLHNTGSKGSDLAGKSLSNKESQNRKSSGSGIMLANAINLLGFTLGAMDYYNASKPTVANNSNSSSSNQESSKKNQPQPSQDDPSDEISNQNSNENCSNVPTVKK